MEIYTRQVPALTNNLVKINNQMKMPIYKKHNIPVLIRNRSYDIHRKQFRLNEVKKELKIPKRTFKEKVIIFKTQIKTRKISWKEGHELITVDRENIINQSMAQFNKINLYKELKISFLGEVNNDSGGLIREWLTVLFTNILEHSGLFEKADTDDFSYLPKKNSQINEEDYEKYIFIGKIISKSLLENLTVNCCFNLLIYKIILEEEIKFEDLIFIDAPLYRSLLKLKQMDNIEDLEIYWTIEEVNSNGQIETIPLKKKGESLLVTKSTLNDYIEARINYLISIREISIAAIKQGMFELIQEKFYKNFYASELSLLIDGTPFIDIDDWRMNSIYRNYENYDENILNFWKVMETLSQEQLSKFLQFSTGSRRVPIGGFASLESNRGNSSKFCISKVQYNYEGPNFIIAHTCFNRIDLPDFPKQKMVKDAIDFVLANEVTGFGIE